MLSIATKYTRWPSIMSLLACTIVALLAPLSCGAATAAAVHPPPTINSASSIAVNKRKANHKIKRHLQKMNDGKFTILGPGPPQAAPFVAPPPPPPAPKPSGGGSLTNWINQAAKQEDATNIEIGLNGDGSVGGVVVSTHGCNPGECYVMALAGCFHITSQECRIPPPVPVPPPTPRPSLPFITSTHPIEILLTQLPFNYAVSNEARAMIIRYIRDLLENAFSLDSDINLCGVSFGGYLFKSDGTIKSIPVEVCVDGRSDISDFVLSYIMEIMESSALVDLVTDLKNYDWTTYGNVDIEVDTYSKDDIVYETFKPTTKPTSSPTPSPVANIVTSIHHIQTILKGVASDYTLAAEERADIMRYINEILEIQLPMIGLELVQVKFAGYITDESGSTDDDVRIPMHITVKGSKDVTDFAASYIMELIDENAANILAQLKTDNWSAFKNVVIDSDTFNVDYLVDGTDQPSRRPTAKPVINWVEAALPVSFNFKNVDTQYKLSKKDTAELLSIFEDTLVEHLEEPHQLVKIKYKGAGSGQRLKNFPVEITVKSPAADSEYALAYILGALEDNMRTIMIKVKTMNWTAFKGISIETEMYDPEFVLDQFMMIETEHDVQVSLDGLSSGHKIAEGDREKIVNYIQELMVEELGELDMSLVDLDSEGYTNGPVIPLRVTVDGQAELADTAKSIVMTVLDDNTQKIDSFIKELDYLQYKDVSVSSGPYNEAAANPMISSVHYVEIKFDGGVRKVRSGHRLSETERIEVISYIKELLTEELSDESKYGLLDVVGVGYDKTRSGIGSLPLVIETNGPEEGPALEYILQALEKNTAAIEQKFKSMDWSTYKAVAVSVASYDPNVPETILEETTLPIQLKIDGVPNKYQVSATHKSELLTFTNEMMENNLIDTCRFTRVAYESSNIRYLGTSSYIGQRLLCETRRVNFIYLPFEITVECPAQDSDLALSFVLDAIDGNKAAILQKLKSLDYGSFNGASVSASSYDPQNPPEPVKMMETEHPIQLDLDGLPDGFRQSAIERAPIIRFVTDLLEKKLDGSFELVLVADASKNPSRDLSSAAQNTRRLASASIHLIISVNGPVDQADCALSNVMETLESQKQEITQFLKSRDWDKYKDVRVSASTYDLESLNKPVKLKLTSHAVKLTCGNIADGYRLTPEHREATIGFTEKLLEANIDESFTVEGIAYEEPDVRSAGDQCEDLDTWSGGGCPVSHSVGTDYGPGDLVTGDYCSHVYQCAEAPNNLFCGMAGYEPGNPDPAQAWKQAWTVLGSCNEGSYTPPLWSGRTCPEAYSVGTDYAPGAVAHVVKTYTAVYQCAEFPNNLYCGMAGYEPDTGSAWSMAWSELGSCEGGDTQSRPDRVTDDTQENPGTLHGKQDQNRRHLNTNTVFLPLRIAVEGPEDQSDYALPAVMDVLNKRGEQIEQFLRSLDYNTFHDVDLSAKSFDDFASMSQSMVAESSHAFMLNINNIPVGYSLSADKRSALIRHVDNLVEDDLDDSLYLLGVVDTSDSVGKRRLERFRTGPKVPISLPISVTVLGPIDEEDLARSHVEQALRDNIEDIEEYLLSLDAELFKDSTVSITSPNNAKSMNEESESPWWISAWWVWLLVAIGFAVVLCCVCICCYCMCRFRYKYRREMEIESEVVVKEDPVIVEKPIIYERLVMPPPHAMLPYYPNQNMDPYQRTPMFPPQDEAHIGRELDIDKDSIMEDSIDQVNHTLGSWHGTHTEEGDYMAEEGYDEDEHDSWVIDSVSAASVVPYSVDPPDERSVMEQPLAIIPESSRSIISASSRKGVITTSSRSIVSVSSRSRSVVKSSRASTSSYTNYGIEPEGDTISVMHSMPPLPENERLSYAVEEQLVARDNNLDLDESRHVWEEESYATQPPDEMYIASALEEDESVSGQRRMSAATWGEVRPHEQMHTMEEWVEEASQDTGSHYNSVGTPGGYPKDDYWA